jgi:hypothetical protein
VLYLALIAGGLVLGLVLGRWWTLAAAAGIGIWIGLIEEVEVPGWVLGVGYAVLAAVGISTGVLARKALARR